MKEALERKKRRKEEGKEGREGEGRGTEALGTLLNRVLIHIYWVKSPNQRFSFSFYSHTCDIRKFPS